MDIWKILSIKRTDNIKEIKQAYAKKLKVTRPDENPEKFQELHAAYKIAISQQKYQWTDTEGDYEAQDNSFYGEYDEHGNNMQKNISQEIENIAPSPASIRKTDSDEPEDKYEIEISRLIEISQKLLDTETAFNEIEEWHFLINSPYILDTNFNWDLGIGTLQLLGKHNKKNFINRINPEIINYLNNIFNWHSNRDYIDSLLDSDTITGLLDNISETHNVKKLSGLRGSASIKFAKPEIHQFHSMHHATIVKRFFAFSIDVIILTSLFWLMFLTPLFDREHIQVGYLTALLLLISAAYFFFFEISPLRSSPGKMTLGLILANQHYERISIIQALVRTSLGFLAISIYVSLILYATSGFHLGVSLGLCIVTLRMLIFLCSNPVEKILLNDMLSKTYVFDFRKAQREHSNNQ